MKMDIGSDIYFFIIIPRKEGFSKFLLWSSNPILIKGKFKHKDSKMIRDLFFKQRDILCGCRETKIL